MHVKVELDQRGFGDITVAAGRLEDHVRGVSYTATVGERPTLTLDVVPGHVTIEGDAVLYLVVGDRRFRVVEEPNTGLFPVQEKMQLSR